MSFIIKDCQRCGTQSVQMNVEGYSTKDNLNFELFVVCNRCARSSIYAGQPQGNFSQNLNLGEHRQIDALPVQVSPQILDLSDDIPQRTREIFIEAATCRSYGLSEASGAMFRKAIDVGTKEFYARDERLSGKTPANALRSRINALGDMNILDPEIVELADIAALDGNDAAHDEDPYTAEEAEALEELTLDLLDRLFVRPAKIKRVKEKQIAAGLRK